MTAPVPPVPRWKIWHPLPFWQVIVILLVTNLIFGVIVGVVHGATGWNLGGGTSGGVAGVVSWLLIVWLARRAKR